VLKPKNIKDLVSEKLQTFGKKPVYAKHEWQDFGVKVAKELEDDKRAGMYIKFTRNYGKEIVEEALDFVKESNNVKSKPRLFLWKLKKLKKDSKYETV